jgi:hypothetical protein
VYGSCEPVKTDSKTESKGDVRLTPDELVALAERKVAATDPVEVERIKTEMECGFYGDV